LKFNIERNVQYKDPLTLRKFIELNNVVDTPLNLNEINPDDTDELLENGLITKKEDKIIYLRGAFNNELTVEQITVLYDIILRDLPNLANGEWNDLYHHFMAKYNYVKEKASRGEVTKIFGYLKSIIGKR